MLKLFLQLRRNVISNGVINEIDSVLYFVKDYLKLGVVKLKFNSAILQILQYTSERRNNHCMCYFSEFYSFIIVILKSTLGHELIHEELVSPIVDRSKL